MSLLLEGNPHLQLLVSVLESPPSVTFVALSGWQALQSCHPPDLPFLQENKLQWRAPVWPQTVTSSCLHVGKSYLTLPPAPLKGLSLNLTSWYREELALHIVLQALKWKEHMIIPVVSLIYVPRASGTGDPVFELKQVTGLRQQEASCFYRYKPSCFTLGLVAFPLFSKYERLAAVPRDGGEVLVLASWLVFQ